MQAQTLIVEKRTETGKGAANRLRRQGKLPVNFYGKKIGSLPVVVPVKEMESILKQEGENTIIKVRLADQEYSAVFREVQRHPLTRKLTHVDLYQISLEDKLRVEVPLVVTGEAKGVKAGGILQQVLRHLEVEGLPTDLPENIVVDVSDLDLGEHITVAELKLSSDLEVLSDQETVVVSVMAVRMAEAETETEKLEAETTAPEAEPES